MSWRRNIKIVSNFILFSRNTIMICQGVNATSVRTIKKSSIESALFFFTWIHHHFFLAKYVETTPLIVHN